MKKYLVLWSLVAMTLVEQPAPEVLLEQGRLVGAVSEDGAHHRYLGIPYASTTPHTRFQAPGPAPPWEGVLQATQEGPVCPQRFLFSVVGNEDCLRANVYVPVTGPRPLPVMVFIHGGGYTLGSGDRLVYGPDFLVRRGVILVTFNYRLGPLGFLCLNKPQVPGNAGLRDQLAALRWVQRNIDAFGGDPGRVTIFGESAGAISVDYMILANATDGLFQRAILQSGAATSSWALNTDPVWSASLLAEALGFRSNDTDELYKLFRDADVGELVTAKTVKPWSVFHDTQLVYLPCVDRHHPGLEPLVPDLPYNLLSATKRKNISVIYGSNDEEGLFLMKFETEQSLSKRNEGYLFASNLEFNSTREAERRAEEVRQFYFGARRIGLETLPELSRAYTHMYFEMPALLQSEVLLRSGASRVYNYVFQYAGRRNVVKFLSGQWGGGATHGDELFYLFAPPWLPSVLMSNSDRQLIEWMTTMWTNFAKYGNPTPETGEEERVPVRWAQSAANEARVLYIDRALHMGPVPDPRAYHLWKDIYSKHRKKYINY